MSRPILALPMDMDAGSVREKRPGRTDILPGAPIDHMARPHRTHFINPCTLLFASENILYACTASYK